MQFSTFYTIHFKILQTWIQHFKSTCSTFFLNLHQYFLRKTCPLFIFSNDDGAAAGAAGTAARQSQRASLLELGFGNPSPSHNPSVDDRVALALLEAHNGYVPKIKSELSRRTLRFRLCWDLDDLMIPISCFWFNLVWV